MASTSHAPGVTDEKKRLEWQRNTWDSEVVRAIIIESSAITTLAPKEKPKRKIGKAVHTELLCHFSGCYRAAIKGNFSEAKKDTFELDASHEIIDAFIGRLYTGLIGKLDYYHLTELYVLANQTETLALRRAVITQMYNDKVVAGLAGTNVVHMAFDKLPSSAQLLQVYVDSWTYHWSPKDSDPDFETEAPKSFLYRVMVCQATMIQEKRRKVGCACCGDPCRYHEHESEEERLATCGALEQKK